MTDISTKSQNYTSNYSGIHGNVIKQANGKVIWVGLRANDTTIYLTIYPGL